MILSQLLGSFILKVATVTSATTLGNLHSSMQPNIVRQINALNTSHDDQLLESHKLVSYVLSRLVKCV